MPAPRKYTAKQRARAVGVAMVEGVTAAERSTGIPKTTIQDWTKRPEYVHLRTNAREVVAEGMWVGLQIGIRELSDGLTGDAPLHHKAAAFQALANQYALLTGGATSRTESRELNDLPDSAYVDAIHEARRLVGEESPDREAEAEPAV